MFLFSFFLVVLNVVNFYFRVKNFNYWELVLCFDLVKIIVFSWGNLYEGIF